MADMHTPLRECPFCDGEAEILTIEEGDEVANVGGSVVTCRRCLASSPVHFDRKENLVDSWNRRAPSQDAETIKALRDELELAANRIEYAAIHMKIVADQIAGGGDIPASINTWIARQLSKGRSEAAEHAASTRSALAGSAS